MASLRFQTFVILALTGLFATVNPATAMGAPGVTGNTILLGESAAFSGPAAKLGEAMREGATAYFNEINQQGGVYGRQIKLVSLDDGYEPDRAVANTKALIDDKKVFALFGYVGTPTSYAVKPLVDAARIPFFAPFTGAQGLRVPVDRYIFNIRAGYFDENRESGRLAGVQTPDPDRGFLPGRCLRAGGAGWRHACHGQTPPEDCRDRHGGAKHR